MNVLLRAQTEGKPHRRIWQALAIGRVALLQSLCLGAVVAGAETVSNSVSNPPASDPVHSALRDSERLFPSTNLVKLSGPAKGGVPAYKPVLEEALRARTAKNAAEAEKLFIRVLQMPAPEEAYKTALLEMAVLAHERSDLLKAQQIYSQFVSQYPGDLSTPEVLLRQGLLYREMGAPVMASAKFYAVMSSALNLKLERLDYYQRLVLRAQAEIGETCYAQGKYAEAAEFFTRMLKLDSPELDRSGITCKLIRSLAGKGAFNEVVTHARLYLERYPEASSSPEVRYLFATALNNLGRKDEATEQVLDLLRSQEKSASEDPQNWIYWRQRTGNDIANQFYQQGDFNNALLIYQTLATLSNAPEWQLPALYQAGLVYERLRQPDKALETYAQLLERRPASTNAPSPSLTAVLDMASWRKAHLAWAQRAEDVNRRLLPASLPEAHE
jgi:tetratricopeptide (TPR) repeat protein